ncbi:hypothetical protein QTN25_000821 [Entamoeba marina]
MQYPSNINLSPSINQPYANQPYTNQPYTNQPYTNQPYTNQPYTNQPYYVYPTQPIQEIPQNYVQFPQLFQQNVKTTIQQQPQSPQLIPLQKPEKVNACVIVLSIVGMICPALWLVNYAAFYNSRNEKTRKWALASRNAFIIYQQVPIKENNGQQDTCKANEQYQMDPNVVKECTEQLLLYYYSYEQILTDVEKRGFPQSITSEVLQT